MKERQIKSQAIPTLGVQVLDGEFALLWDEDKENGIEHIETSEYAYEVYKLLKKADEEGAFNHIKKDSSESDIGTVFV